jgi:peptide-methionine (S)-S-oxide reductase
MNEEKATLGGGCFWCIEAMYKQLKGVSTVVSGYSGGKTPNPTYEQTHIDDTGHAEVIQVTFDPKVISYRELLEIFFVVHDPTTLNRQGNDIGTEYRSIILFHNEAQGETAKDVLENFAKDLWDSPIVTEIKPLDTFWPAEDYHQDFYAKNPESGYCQVIINPKLAKFRQKFTEKLKP